MILADHFRQLGFGAADAESRAALVDRVSEGFAALTGAPPAWRWFVPGRLEVLGKHTDYAGGHVLTGAVPRGFAMVAGARRDRRVRVVDIGNQVQVEFGLDDDGPARTGWASYIQVTLSGWPPTSRARRSVSISPSRATCRARPACRARARSWSAWRPHSPGAAT